MPDYNYDPQQVVSSVDELRTLYGPPVERALKKELDFISSDYAKFIHAAPFVVVGSVGPEGLDTSPRGDAPGFVTVVDQHTLMLPDRRGNNRADTLTNVVRDPRVSLLFLIPGIGETLRVIGEACMVTDAKLCEQFVVQSKAPRSVMVVKVQRVYFQCQKALARSHLWDSDHHIARDALPTTGQMLAAVDETFDGAAYDAGYPEHLQKTLY